MPDDEPPHQPPQLRRRVTGPHGRLDSIRHMGTLELGILNILDTYVRCWARVVASSPSTVIRWPPPSST